MNCDVGEGVGNEADIFPYISSCNIACGGHAGDRETMRHIAELALKNSIKIGAHPSYPDRVNFGRKTLKMPFDALKDAIIHQIAELESVLQELGAELHHIKAHGALYNDLAQNNQLAGFYLNTLLLYRDKLILYAPYGSAFENTAREMGFKVWAEGFADRGYLTSGTLAARNLSGALIADPELVWKQLHEMITKNRVHCLDGNWFKIEALTYCIHGDTPNSSEIIQYLSRQLKEESIKIGF